MRVVLDRDLCQANGVCMALAPAVFELDDDLELRILVDVVPEDAEDDTREAATQCPRSALTIQ
ncbi:ferredoxin [Mycolicibacterium porcinum]|uniref:Ferredoxin n=1 Tax=Mycolicibacterium porcinum TaxID=39693 RepID=A0AAW5SWY3_9MYCO|nr:ferredoxin [Mycolicibacterium porcinum]MCV7386479.1 ferredoxin [Mycolicibacterium porcinum]ORB39027.1 ferredoxin [Mycolicibacterium porcinum]CDO30851.1 ferredoxin [Mycolicibacterium vulneris]